MPPVCVCARPRRSENTGWEILRDERSDSGGEWGQRAGDEGGEGLHLPAMLKIKLAYFWVCTRVDIQLGHNYICFMLLSVRTHAGAMALTLHYSTHTHTHTFLHCYFWIGIHRAWIWKMSPPGFCGGSLVAGGGLRVPYYRQTSVWNVTWQDQRRY